MWSKKYEDYKPYKKVKCIDNTGCVLLKQGIRGVIDENETQYLIQFMSGAAKWYSKDRFYEPKPNQAPVLDAELTNQIQDILTKI